MCNHVNNRKCKEWQKQLKNQKNFLGKIKSLKNDIIIISTDKEDIEIDFKNIKKANIKEI